MPRNYHLPRRSPIAFFSPDPKEDLSTLAVALVGYRTEGQVNEEVSQVTDIWVALLRNPEADKRDLAKSLGMSYSTLRRRMATLQEILTEDL